MGLMIKLQIILALGFALILVGCGSSREDSDDSAGTQETVSDGQIAPLLSGLGDFTHPISTDNPMAQRFFDQGLMLAFGFNHAEAERSFREAARRDPDCAMCYWGIALVLGPNINAPMEPDNVPKAWQAIESAVQLADNVPEWEQAYIDMLAERYSNELLNDRTPLDTEYAQAMRELVELYPEDMDARALLAEALMDLHPWDYWLPSGDARPWTEEIIEHLEFVRGVAPNHPLANHLYIHAVEASQTPERGLDAAKRLGDVAPGAGHLVHMPSHIYIRTGMYHEGTLANERAIQSDDEYVNQCRSQGIYPLAYVPHNHHFLWATATLEGRSDVSIRAANTTHERVDTTMMRQPGFGTLQHFYIIPYYAMVRFGKWDDILDEAPPSEDLVYPTGIWHYARGIAFARTGRVDEAKQELTRVRDIATNPALNEITIWNINATASLMKIAAGVLAGEIAAAGDDYENAIKHLADAIDLEDRLAYNEPPDWFFPVRQTLGAVLLEAGRARQAEVIYREDLDVFPKNGWSLYGLAQSLRDQEKTMEAEEVERQFENAWKYSDVTLQASRF